MNLLRGAFAVLASTVVLGTSPVGAQSKYVQPYFTFSVSAVDSVRDAGHSKLIPEGVIGLKLLPQSTVGFLVAGFAGAAIDPPLQGDELSCPIEPGGGCRPELAGFSFYGIQVGGQLRYQKLSLEVTSGPGVMHFNARNNSSGRARAAVNVSSIHTRVEGAILFGTHIGMVVTGAWRRVPKYDGASLSANGLGLGLRIQ